ncbi:hypothetical protein DYB36_009819 [Aphanomyces astaci]|uniref:Reverse transcriptase Ty1/copia-type domain-containing protein n=1 Tax=Aphanomyces astaci TaxID=112090 RepID=A0A396ZVX4_APHAT|nr:hypothetical protein DYB36_009819 [Aphanomyces astaci]
MRSPQSPRSDASIGRTPKSHTPMMRESANESVSNARGSARLEEVAKRREAAAARTTETQLDERPPLHPVRSSARPYNADMPFMEAPANTTRTEDGERQRRVPPQKTHIERMAAKYGLTNSKRVDTPIPADNLAADAGLPLDDKPFRTIVGSLMYCAMVTRPDIVLAVTQLSRHLSALHQLHMARLVVTYLLHTKDVGISFDGKPRWNGELIGFSDSSWADDRATGCSLVTICGYLLAAPSRGGPSFKPS